MNKTVYIQIKNDNYAYLTCEDAGLFRLFKMSFTRRVRKYNNYWRIYEDKQNVHFGLVNNGTVLKVKAGLISFLTNSLSERNISYALSDERVKADFKTQPVFELSDKVELRDYQKEAVVAALNARYCSVQLTTGSGKTEVAASIIRTYLATNFMRAVLYVVPTIKLQLEAEERFTRYGIKCNTKLPFINGYANIITYASLVRSKIPYQEKDRVGALLFDECFTPDTEILTENGFIRFDCLTDEKVAQIDNNSNISFVKPIRKIKRFHNGDIEHLKGYNFDFYMTSGHNQPLLIGDALINFKAKDLTMLDGKQHSTIKFITSGKSIEGSINNLSPIDKLAILIQADASLNKQNKGDTDYWLLSLKRDDKIKNFETILKNCPSDIKYTKLKSSRQDIKRYGVIVPKKYNISKRLSTYFSLQHINESFAKDFMEELLNWDGYRFEYEHLGYYSCVDEENVDFAQAVAVLANYKTYKTIQVDNRKASYKDVYRLFWNTKDIYESATYKTKTTEYYEGYVYCVEVPTHKIIIRRNGKVIVSGNCHHLKGPKNSKIVHEYKKLGMIVGLSATVTPDVQYKEKLNRLNDDDFSILGCTGKTVYYKEIDETIAENFVTPVEITVLDNLEKVPLTEDELSEWHSLRRKVLMSPHRAKLVAQFTHHICEQKDFNTVMLLIPEVDWSQQYMLEVAKYNPDYRIILMFGQNRYGEVINGQIIPLYRKDKEQAYADIKNPNVKTIFSATSFAYEGMDVTNMQALINVYGGKSVTRVKQQAGRVMRLFADKNMAYIYEIYDKQPVLKAQLKKRLDIYDKEYHARILKSNFKMEE